MKSSRTAAVAAIIALCLAVYETVAITTNAVPTVTEFIEELPEGVELVVVGGLMVWLAWHFGWLNRLLRLLGR